MAVVAVTGLLWLGPGPARANEYTINACQADRAEFSTQAFEDFANRGMMWRRACNPEGPGLRGLVTANVVRAGRVVRGSRSYFVLRAPEGTRFGRLTWSGQARRRDCRYALQLWADRPDGSTVAIKNVRANRGCPNQGKAQAAGWPRAHSYDIGGTTKIVQRVLCVGSTKTPYCSSRGLNYIRTFTAAATVVDASPPGVTITQNNAFTRGEWVNETQQVDYSALDNVGVKVARAIVTGLPRGEHLRPCNYAQRVPCTNGPGSVSIRTTSLPDGSQSVSMQAEDAAGNLGMSPPVPVHVDNTAPGAVPIGLTGGDDWRNQNDFDAIWTNPAEADRAPIVAAHYRLCPVGSGACLTDRRFDYQISQIADLAVPSAGEWRLEIWREDAAGNQQPANASVPVTLRYDPEPPQIGFENPPSSDPTLISALVTDEVSGLAEGQIELSREGSNVWEGLPTRQERSRLVTRIDDARFAPGSYVLRATARDHASNLNSTDRRLDGELMRLTLPLRARTVVTAGVTRGRPRQRTRPRRERSLLRQVRVPFGHQVRIVGQLKTRDGRPLGGAELQVLSRDAATAEQSLASLRTDERGRYSYVAEGVSSQVLRVVYAGSATTLPSQAEVTLLVPAASTIDARPRHLRNGRAVTFTGRLRSLPPPPEGKLVELQVVLSGRWQTFRTVRTSPAGTWRVRYRFRRSCGALRYRFRARLAAESGYPYETGHTRIVSVRVRGAPCR